MSVFVLVLDSGYWGYWDCITSTEGEDSLSALLFGLKLWRRLRAGGCAAEFQDTRRAGILVSIGPADARPRFEADDCSDPLRFRMWNQFGNQLNLVANVHRIALSTAMIARSARIQTQEALA